MSSDESIMTNGQQALEDGVMEMLLAGDDPKLSCLRAQWSASTIVKRTFTGAGFFVDFAIPADLPRLQLDETSHFGDVQAEIEGLQHGAGFVLFVSKGALDYLEGYSYDESWPTDIGCFQLSYPNGKQRDLTTLWGTKSG